MRHAVKLVLILALPVALISFLAGAVALVLGTLGNERGAYHVRDPYAWVYADAPVATPTLPHHSYPYRPSEIGFSADMPAGYYEVHQGIYLCVYGTDQKCEIQP